MCVKIVAVIDVIGCYCRLRAFQLGGRDICRGSPSLLEADEIVAPTKIDAPPERVGTFFLIPQIDQSSQSNVFDFRKAGGRHSSASAAHGRITWMGHAH
jgi:hypothetical protein